MVECLNVIPRMTLMLMGDPKKHIVSSPQTSDYALCVWLQPYIRYKQFKLCIKSEFYLKLIYKNKR